MPRWGRPPGARMGRHTRGREWDEIARVEEIESDEEHDEYEREMLRSGRVSYMRQLEYGGRGPRRRDYEDLTDEAESDSTVAYAVQLAMRDKEDQLVEKALGRIRRAQMLGKKNVRLSQRELDALERRRLQTDNGRRPKHPGSPTTPTAGRPGSRRNGSGAPLEQSGPYPHFAPDAHSSWSRGPGGRPSSSSSGHRPRTPTTQSLRPQQSNSPLRPSYPPFPPNNRPQSMHQHAMYPRPLPDDPQWAPPYYKPVQMAPYMDQAPYPPQPPTDHRSGPTGRMSYPSGETPYPAQHRSPLDGRPSGAPFRGGPPAQSETESDVSSEEEEETESSEDDGEVQVVPVERQGPPGLQKRTVSGGSRGSWRARR
ncbi:hypothetical protein NUU61_008934 [Penicillium alfredii]|uniref:Prenylated Rab acceptor 1 n=1 Tax=Penicillium alfredii TaxID=1506179 RepID=A0A9W9EMA7_9EURO|nr:uncharacterized protein NUU61_008934 [Penicillium alfredii]KAJ5084355.1 hypothetical protein NUU61_008934 [Penicillium alfredii]